MDRLNHTFELESIVPGCPPGFDPEMAYIEAVAGIEARERGLPGNWSHPAIYWATTEVGAFDLKSFTYDEIRLRWECALVRAFLTHGHMPVPPARAPVGQASAEWTPPVENTSKRVAMEEIRRCLYANEKDADHKRWARRIMVRIATGDRSISASMEAVAKAALD